MCPAFGACVAQTNIQFEWTKHGCTAFRARWSMSVIITHPEKEFHLCVHTAQHLPVGSALQTSYEGTENTPATSSSPGCRYDKKAVLGKYTRCDRNLNAGPLPWFDISAGISCPRQWGQFFRQPSSPFPAGNSDSSPAYSNCVCSDSTSPRDTQVSPE